MPHGLLNGISTEKGSEVCQDDEGDEGEDNNVNITMQNGSGLLTSGEIRRRHNSNSNNNATNNNLNFIDLLKTGAMVGIGEKNGSCGGSERSLRLSSGPRDADYVILVLNQKQRESEEVNALLEKLRDTHGVTSLFMKNGTSPTLPKSAPLPPVISSPPEVTKPIEEICSQVDVQVSNKIPSPSKRDSPQCNGVEKKSRKRTKNETSESYSPKNNVEEIASSLIDKLQPNNFLGESSSSFDEEEVESLGKKLTELPVVPLEEPDPETLKALGLSTQIILPTSTSSTKKKRKRRRKYPYLDRKPVKKKKVSAIELNEESEESTAQSVQKPETVVFSPSKLKIRPFTKAKVNKTKIKGKKPRKVKAVPITKSPKLKSPKKSAIVKPNGLLSPEKFVKEEDFELLTEKPSGSKKSDPYVFIPDDDSDFYEPPPLKLFSPKSPRKNGICSPTNGFKEIAATTAATELVAQLPATNSLQLFDHLAKTYSSSGSNSHTTTPISSPQLASSQENVCEQEKEEVVKAEQISEDQVPKPKAKRKKRTNEICQLLTWAIAPRPSTPRSTASAITTLGIPYFQKEKEKETIVPSQEIQELLPPKSEQSEPTLLPEEKEEIQEEIVVKEEQVLLQPPTKSQLHKLILSKTKAGKVLKRRKKKKRSACFTTRKTKVQSINKKSKQCVQSMISKEEVEKEEEDSTKTVVEKITSDSVQLAVEMVGENEALRPLIKEDQEEIVESSENDLNPKTSESIPSETIEKDDEQDPNWKAKFTSPMEYPETESGVVGVTLEMKPPPEPSPNKPGRKKRAPKQIHELKIEPEASIFTEPMNICPPGSSEVSEPIKTEHEFIKPKSLPPIAVAAISESTITSNDPNQQNPPNEFLDAMQLRRPSFYSLIAGNVRNNLENYLDGRMPEAAVEGTKNKRRKRPKPRNGFLLHHGDNFPEDPEAPYKLALATQILLKLNKRRSKFKPKEDKGKSLLSYLKLVPKRASRTTKSSTLTSLPPPPSKEGDESAEGDKVPDHNGNSEETGGSGSEPTPSVTSVFSGEWVQQRNFVCNICGQVEKSFWDMMVHKGEIHPGIVVTHVELVDMPPTGFRAPPPVPPPSANQPPPCTKCQATFSNFADLHRHIFECAGNATWLEELKEETQSPRKKRSKRKRGFNSFKRRLSNTPKKTNPTTRKTEIFKCEFCTRFFKTEGWLKNHLTTHSLPISIPLDKLKQTTLPTSADNIKGRRSAVQNLIKNGSFKK